jgi:hypothetical protein
VAFADNSNGAAASVDDARNAWVNADFLFESVVCDLHLAALTAGGFAMLLTARSLADNAWTLRSWRSVLIDDGQTMRLTLRFRCDMGMSAATAAQLAEIYAGLARAKAGTPDDSRLSDRAATLRSAEQWRRLGAEFKSALEGVMSETRRRLPAPYDDDGRALIAFLGDAAKGDTRRVSRTGEIELPRLRQRRSSPRAAVRHACALLLPGGRVAAEIEDVSRNGLGLRCGQTLREGQEVVVELESGRKLTGVVVRVKGEQAGLKLSAPLPGNDPLFARG